jgi:hypothetical protein
MRKIIDASKYQLNSYMGIVESVLGAVAGGVVSSAMSGGKSGGGSAGTTTTTASNAPWQPMQQYLTGGNQKRVLKPGVSPTYDPSVSAWGDIQGAQNNPESDYITTGHPGIADISSDIYGTTGMTDAQKQWQAQQQSFLNTANSDPSLNASILKSGADINKGIFDTNYGKVPGIQGAPAVSFNPSPGVSSIGTSSTGFKSQDPQNVNFDKSNAVSAYNSLGAANPSTALQQQLSGQVNNPYLDQQIAGIANDLGSNLDNYILPQVRSAAESSGQYGGSRQGIAEGLAAKAETQQLANQAANLRSSAYQQAQGLQGAAANNLSGQALNNSQFNSTGGLNASTVNANLGQNNSQFNANLGQGSSQFNANLGQTNNQFNASNDLKNNQYNTMGDFNAQTANASNLQNTQQFNANLGINNNTQQMAQQQANLQNRVSGSNLINGGTSAYNNTAAAGNTLFDTTRNAPWADLSKYQSVIQPLSALGNASTQSTPYYTNPTATIMGGALGGAQLANSLFGSSGSSGSNASYLNGLYNNYYTPTNNGINFGGNPTANSYGDGMGGYGTSLGSYDASGAGYGFF